MAEQVRISGDRWTNVCGMMPEKSADVISEILNFENLPCFTQIINCLKPSQPLHRRTTIII